MPLNDTFVKKVKYAGKSSGEKHADGGGMYLHVTEAGKYWRLAYLLLVRGESMRDAGTLTATW